VPVDDARRVIEDAGRAGVFPAATAEVGSSGSPLFADAYGADPSTPFDLASLTKVIATTTVVMELVRRRVLSLEEPVSEFFREWRGADREAVTVRDLLEHASGLPARLVDAPPPGRREFEHDICATPLEYAPCSRSIYSDLGFILLGFLAEDRGGGSLAQLCRWPGIGFMLPPDLRALAAPTRPMDEDPRRGRVLTGEVHDNYAAALGGVAGHAGLFAAAPAVGSFARAVLRAARGDESVPEPFTPDLVARFTTKTSVPGSSRALGWDTMLPTSSCGTRMSTEAFGHVGYTGTSLWIDPVRDRYFVLLTNRVYGGGTLEDIRAVRRAFHDALGDV
jgi:serine-type D-Ala-D-Ala carboxypeptidase